MKPLNDKDGSQYKTNDLLTVDITKSKSGTIRKQGGSPQLSQNAYGINEALVDDPEYMYMHHETMQAKQLSTWNVRSCKGNFKS